MAHNDIKSLRAEWRRQWRATSGKIGVTIYFNRFEVDVLDWLTWQLLHESAKPEAVGRPAALRKLVAKYADDHRDEFAKWRQSVPGPEEQAIFYRRELGQRRRDVPRGKNLSDAE